MNRALRMSIYGVMLVLFSFNAGLAQKRKKGHSKQHAKEHSIVGTATWYSSSFNGRKTASGEIFSQKKLTCATNKFKIGTWLRVENISNKKFIIVRVNDRMAAHPRKIIDLTRIAAVELGMIKKGCARVRIESLGTSKPAEAN
jgi:rare lipoprotein A